MIKRLIVAAMALSLAACSTAGALDAGARVAAGAADAAGLKPYAPLATTTADENVGIGLLHGYDAFLTVVDVMDAGGLLPPTSARVRSLADAIHSTTAALRTAAAARRLGQSANYTAAYNEAKRTFALAQKILGGN